MSSKLYKVFEEVELQAKVLSNYWHDFYSEISQHLPESYQPEMQELSAKLGEALENLIGELHNPTLTIATAGTTSSGKSTLVNLLCGVEIVPVAVSKMSAGVVTIEYSEEKSLVIHETRGAKWECGEWRGIHEDEIRQRLYDVTISYTDNREKYPDLACPQSVIGFPFRLLKESKLQLPRGTRVRIMDLPGLAYVGDEGNASVIRRCREALCIVAYNSEEIDQQKVRNLLQEVVEQVKDLGGSPARMLFVLNKIDVFRADRSWPDSENRFVDKTIKSIKTELLERLKEYTDDIEKLKFVKLSAWSALLSHQIRQRQEINKTSISDQIKQKQMIVKDVLEDLPSRREKWSPHDKKRFDEASANLRVCELAHDNFYRELKWLTKCFSQLVSRDLLEDLPHRVERWSMSDCNRVAKDVWQKSYAEEFEDHLKNHINQHFPQLVIPQMIERFNIHGGYAVSEWAVQITTAILNSLESDYIREVDLLNSYKRSGKIFDERINHSHLIEKYMKHKAVWEAIHHKALSIDEEFSNFRKFGSTII